MRACAYPRVGDACLGVLEGREEPHGQVVSHVEQFIVIVLNGHVPKRLLGVRYYSVGRKETSQDPGDRKNTDIIRSRWLYTHTVQFSTTDAASKSVRKQRDWT